MEFWPSFDSSVLVPHDSNTGVTPATQTATLSLTEGEEVPLTKEETRKGDARGKPELPVTLRSAGFIAAWAEYEAYRRRSKWKKLLPESVEKQWKDLAEWGEERAIKAIHNTMKRGYQGIFEPKENDHGRSGNGGGGGTTGGMQGHIARQRERLAGMYPDTGGDLPR